MKKLLDVFKRMDMLEWTIVGCILSLVLCLAVPIYMEYQSPLITEGEVIGKDHEAAWTQVIPITVGETTTMSTIHHPECWKVTIGNAKNGERVTESFCVSHGKYESLAMGEYVNMVDAEQAEI